MLRLLGLAGREMRVCNANTSLRVDDIGFNHRGLAVVAPAIGPAYNTECDQIG